MSTNAPSVGRGVRPFLAITFGLTWLPFLPVLVGAPAVPLLMPFAPAIACVVVRRWVTREGFADVGLRLRLGQSWPWLVVALAWPLLAMPLAVALASATGLGGPGLGGLDVGGGTLLLWLGASVLATPVFLGEELGWRGYLQMRIFPGRPLVAATATGVVWGVWHYPLWLTMPDMPLWMLPLMTISVTVLSVFLGWLHRQSATIWAPALGHSTNNTVEAPFGSVAFTGSSGSFSLPFGVSVAIVLAETCVLLGAVAVGTRRRQSDVPAVPAA